MSYRIGALLPADGWCLLHKTLPQADTATRTFRQPIAGFALITVYEYLDGDEGEPRIEALVQSDFGAEVYPASLLPGYEDATRLDLWRVGQDTCDCWQYQRVPTVNTCDPTWCTTCASELRPEEWAP